MQSQRWKPVRLQYRRPGWQDAYNAVIAGIVIYLLPQVPPEMTGLALLPLLRCLRFKRVV
ncbi:hypothetical protein DCW30_25515 [Streptomyces alfalfae]|uniref:Uncharacterized protein n=1 Tax=Streptomyces alfalfae TaxID=1642299 RepID=A0ABM6GQ74_9ACTN|nr:hypothetical protein A7J05_07495 [Streptomyces alfalfae]AYA15927.1 hypothetical protein D3X13_06580 [Streptomyces fradiae]RXX39401.1 hypothetical protein DCW30_25515 [Streptomyces alfalfae]RZM83695.1 hypothetical protein D4104_33010 [Streptomyces alfalfae]